MKFVLILFTTFYLRIKKDFVLFKKVKVTFLRKKNIFEMFIIVFYCSIIVTGKNIVGIVTENTS